MTFLLSVQFCFLLFACLCWLFIYFLFFFLSYFCFVVFLLPLLSFFFLSSPFLFCYNPPCFVLSFTCSHTQLSELPALFFIFLCLFFSLCRLFSVALFFSFFLSFLHLKTRRRKMCLCYLEISAGEIASHAF